MGQKPTDERIEKGITTLSQLWTSEADQRLIASTIQALDNKYDLSRKMAREAGVQEILLQMAGRIAEAFGSLFHVWRKRVLDIACGSNIGRAPASVTVNTPFGEKSFGNSNLRSYTAQFEPWFCRMLLELGADPVGVDFGDLEGEAFEHYCVDLGKRGSLDFLPDLSFDAVQDSRLFGSPEFTAEFPPSSRPAPRGSRNQATRAEAVDAGRNCRPFGCDGNARMMLE